MPKKNTPADIKRCKGVRKITMLTAYDYPMAELVDAAGIDIILVGDSLANVVLGLESTADVGMNEMIHHAKAVTRAAKRALVIGDMPFEAYQKDPRTAVDNARRFIGEAGCGAVKIEWFDRCVEVAGAIIQAGIPVIGHIGLTPQTADSLGGFRVQGKDAESARALLDQAAALEEAGCCALVLECVPDKIAGLITHKLRIPTIGIGAGPQCDGQVLVIHDILGLCTRFKPRFVKRYAELNPLITQAIREYKREVEDGSFPAAEHCFTIKDEEYKKTIG